MSQLRSEIERLERALDHLETALESCLEQRGAEFDAAIDHARADAKRIADRLDLAIHRLETVLGP
jgi:hypothetical protein